MQFLLFRFLPHYIKLKTVLPVSSCIHVIVTVTILHVATKITVNNVALFHI